MNKPKPKFSASFFITVWSDVTLNASSFDEAFEEAKNLCALSADKLLKKTDSHIDAGFRLGSITNITESGGL